MIPPSCSFYFPKITVFIFVAYWDLFSEYAEGDKSISKLTKRFYCSQRVIFNIKVVSTMAWLIYVAE